MNRNRSLKALVTVSLVLAACGGKAEEDASRPAFDSGVSGNKTIASLTNQELESIRNSVFEYGKSRSAEVTKEENCRFDGEFAAAFLVGMESTDAEIQQVCESTRQRCLLETESADSITVSDEKNLVATPGIATCVATVEEIETCATDLIDYFVDQI